MKLVEEEHPLHLTTVAGVQLPFIQHRQIFKECSWRMQNILAISEILIKKGHLLIISKILSKPTCRL